MQVRTRIGHEPRTNHTHVAHKFDQLHIKPNWIRHEIQNVRLDLNSRARIVQGTTNTQKARIRNAHEHQMETEWLQTNGMCTQCIANTPVQPGVVQKTADATLQRDKMLALCQTQMKQIESETLRQETCHNKKRQSKHNTTRRKCVCMLPD